MNRQFPRILEHIIFIDTSRKLSRDEIINQMMNQKPLISDEEAFLRHLIRKWNK